MIMNYIYCITNTINNKRYVGKTTCSIQKRFQEHCKESTRSHSESRPLYSAMQKYGIENFIIEQLEEIEDESLLSEREQYWIAELETYGVHGYNATKGGDGAVLYDYNEIIDLYNMGYSLVKVAEIIGCNEKTVRNVLKSKGIKSRGHNKIIYQFSLEGEYLQKFDTSIEAANFVIQNNLTKSRDAKGIANRITHNCNGTSKSSYGYIWKYNKN